ncbi:MAG: hypothetical protein E2P02_07455 [Acidobacteria bacterium]|nr:MAG: hypothetical protein E2P02_07455 [Acidobacteriota bacterium]
MAIGTRACAAADSNRRRRQRGSADVALLQLDSPELDLPHARLGDSDQLAVGQDVYVVGTPYGLENSFTVGHVAARSYVSSGVHRVSTRTFV